MSKANNNNNNNTEFFLSPFCPYLSVLKIFPSLKQKNNGELGLSKSLIHFKSDLMHNHELVIKVLKNTSSIPKKIPLD